MEDNSGDEKVLLNQNETVIQQPPKRKNRLFLICGILAILVVIIVVLVLVLNKKDSNETADKITVEEVVKSSGYSEFSDQTDSTKAKEVFSKIEGKVVEDSKCQYGCSKGLDGSIPNGQVEIYFQDSFFDSYEYNTASLANEVLLTFFSNVYPEYDSLGYVGLDSNQNQFYVLSNTGDVYRVNLTSSGKGLSVKNQSGIEILSYSGRLSASEDSKTAVNKPNFIDEASLDEELEEELEKPEDE